MKTNEIKSIGYYNGSFYISKYEYVDFAVAMRNRDKDMVWLASPKWLYTEENKVLFNELDKLYNLRSFHDGEYIVCKDFVT